VLGVIVVGGTVYPLHEITPGAGVASGGYKDIVLITPLTVVKWVVAYCIKSSTISSVLLVGCRIDILIYSFCD
jgi:hypothetical protein